MLFRKIQSFLDVPDQALVIYSAMSWEKLCVAAIATRDPEFLHNATEYFELVRNNQHIYYSLPHIVGSDKDHKCDYYRDVKVLDDILARIQKIRDELSADSARTITYIH